MDSGYSNLVLKLFKENCIFLHFLNDFSKRLKITSKFATYDAVKILQNQLPIYVPTTSSYVWTEYF